MASVIAEVLRQKDLPVTLVTPESMVSSWGDMTSEQAQINRRLLEVGVEIITAHALVSYNGTEAQMECKYTGKLKPINVDAVVTVTMRTPDDDLFREVEQKMIENSDKKENYQPKSLTRIGDCEAPAIIAAAVFAGHRYARELDTEVDPDNRMKYDRVFYEDD
jgi:dimethylamine/trimethylamine dehydrogenase